MSNQKSIIIAIDGFSSSGKSTMARSLARNIGYRYVDSGAMYRAVTLFCLKNGLMTPEGHVNEGGLKNKLPEIEIDFKVMPDGSQHTLLNGEDVEAQIRDMLVSNNVSIIAALPFVRHALVAKQQEFGKSKGIVMDGRDIGTTVFPDAELKVYVNAPAETRAQRRFKELMSAGRDVNYEEVLANVVQRDHIDTTRAESPLRRADDAIDLDNTNMSIEQQDEWLIARAKEAIARNN